MAAFRLGLLVVCILGTRQIGVAEEPHPQRIVCLGDSITDGNTYPLLIQQAIKASGKPVPLFLNAGIGGDTAAGMLSRLEADVIARKPDRVLLSVGVNDFHRRVTLEDYLERVGQIVDQLTARKIRVTILTTTALRDEASQHGVDQWNARLRQLAKDKNAGLADVAAAFAAHGRAGEKLLESDGIHVNFDGYRTMVRGILDGIGHSDVTVPEQLEISLMPGVLPQWRIRVAPDNKPLDEAAVTALKPDDTWKEYTVPDTDKHEHWWWNQEQQRGFAINLKERIGDGNAFQGLATLDSPERRTAYLCPGGQLRTIWLNGRKIYQTTGYPGWHVQEGVEATLEKGANTIVIETGPQFFLSVTDEKD